MHILDKYQQQVRNTESLLCIGLDSRLDRIPERFKKEKHPQFAFNRWIIEQTYSIALAYKPNLAFYESPEGLEALAMTLDYLRVTHPEVITIADAKRGDIGSSNEGYAQSIFDRLNFDAVTLNPYTGQEALLPFLNRQNKGCIILCRTSNPGADEFQGLKLANDDTLWAYIARQVVTRWNQNRNCMVVVGATQPDILRRVRTIVGDMPILVPGVGVQGGNMPDVLAVGLTPGGDGLIVNVGRSVIFADNPGDTARRLYSQMRILRQN
jgi:orotidine-5'-phosphate decarboxylase